jgi:glycosyltransferase involved in cell wall biosynthesis
LKISLVTETFPPEINGVAMTLSHLVEGLVDRGHSLTVVRPKQSAKDIPSPDTRYDQWLYRGCPIPGYSMLKLGLPAGASLRRRWSDLRPDVVHIATEGPLGLSALRAARSIGIPVTSTFHTNFHSYSRHYGFPFLARLALGYLRYFHNRTRMTLSPTAELNQALEADGFLNMRLLSRGVNTRVFSPSARRTSLRERYGAAPDDLLVVHVSRLAPEKNYGLLLQAYEEIRRHDARAVFVIVSDGPIRRKLERQFPFAQFTGFLPREELAAHYASADLFLYPSLTETFGNVVTEAMASGLPVLAFHYAAAARYIKSGHNGWTVPLADRSQFLAAAVLLARDPTLRRRLGANARMTAESISWDRVIDGFERDLKSVLLEHSAPGAPAAVTP